MRYADLGTASDHEDSGRDDWAPECEEYEDLDARYAEHVGISEADALAVEVSAIQLDADSAGVDSDDAIWLAIRSASE